MGAIHEYGTLLRRITLPHKDINMWVAQCTNRGESARCLARDPNPVGDSYSESIGLQLICLLRPVETQLGSEVKQQTSDGIQIFHLLLVELGKIM